MLTVNVNIYIFKWIIDYNLFSAQQVGFAESSLKTLSKG